MRYCSALNATVAVAIAVTACDRIPRDGSDSADMPGFTAWDSAGVEIVENHAPQYAEGRFWTIDPEPEFVLGGSEDLGVLANDSSQLIWEVVGLARLEDGRVAVLSSEGRQLLLFEPSGKLSGTIGRAGRGPGEFTRPEHLQYLPPDTLVVWDYHMTSIDYFDTAGKLLKERSVDHGRLREMVHGASGESLRLPLPDGSFVVSVLARELNPESLESRCPPGRILMPPIGPTGVEPGPYVERTWPASAYTRVDSAYSAQWLGCSGTIAAGGDPLSVYVEGKDGSEIHQFTLEGVLLRIIRRTTDPVPITDRARAATDDRIAREFEARDLPPPPPGWPHAGADTYAWIAGLMVDTKGYLWVQEWSASEKGIPDQWSVLSPEGRWLGVVAVPVDPGPMDPTRCSWSSSCWMDRDYLLTLRVDELGIERVEAYRIRRDG